ncbi:MAG: glycosyltransferase family 39 protein [Chloroflexota bacterium]
MLRLSRFASFFALICILAAAAYVRLRGLAYSPITADQSILLSIALRWVNQGQAMLPLAANKSSAGIMNPPLIAYLLALPLYVQRTLTAVHLFQALLSTTAVLILYLYTRPLFGTRVALLAALLFAVNPWAVYYGRFLWNPNPIPFFATLLLLSLLSYFCGQHKPIHLVLSGLWLAAMTQLHLGSLVLIPTGILILLIFWRHWWQGWQWRTFAPFVGALALLLLLYVPFFIFEYAAGFNDVRATFAVFTGNSNLTDAAVTNPAETNLSSWLLTQELASGSHIFAATGLSREAVWPLYGLFDMAQILLALALIAAVTIPIIAYNRQQRSINALLPPVPTALLILAIWIIAPVLLYLRHTVYLQNYYFLFLFPAPFLLLALLADQLINFLAADHPKLPPAQWRTASANLLVLTPLLLLAAWQFQIDHMRLVQLDAGEIGVERPLSEINQAIHISQEYAAQFPDCDFIIVDEGGTPESSKLGLLEHFVYPTPVRLIDVGRGYIIPQQCAIYLIARADELVTSWLASSGELLPQQVRAGDETWQFYDVGGGGTAVNTPQASWQNGLTLIDAQQTGILAANERLTLTYTWQVTQPQPPGTQYHFFNHFVNEQGEIVAQEDAPAIAAIYWQPGDTLVTQFHLQLPPEFTGKKYSLFIGLYTWPDLQRIPLRNGDTTYMVQTVNIP